jgi:hypothetical protein
MEMVNVLGNIHQLPRGNERSRKDVTTPRGTTM